MIQGLTDLSGRSQLNQIFASYRFSNKTWISLNLGEVAPNSTAPALNSTVMMDAHVSIFDYIIVDTPPIGIVIDADYRSTL